MKTIRSYMVVRKSDGAYLPISTKGHGGTAMEFGFSGPPRMFTSRRTAAIAMAFWMKGVGEMDDEGYVTFQSQAERDPELYEIVEVEIRRAAA